MAVRFYPGYLNALFTGHALALVFEDTLRKDTSDKSDLSGITIKFAFAAEPHGQGSAEERQAADAVTGATGALDPLSSTPVAVGLVGSAVDTGTKVLNVVAKAQKVHTMETTWEVLLRRLERLDEVVTRLTEVFGSPSLSVHAVCMPHRFTRMRR